MRMEIATEHKPERNAEKVLLWESEQTAEEAAKGRIDLIT